MLIKNVTRGEGAAKSTDNEDCCQYTTLGCCKAKWGQKGVHDGTKARENAISNCKNY